MKTVHIWADELGTTSYNDQQQPYFGFGTIASHSPLGELAQAAEALRHNLAADGVDMTKGFHCRDDKFSTRSAFFPIVKEHAGEFQATLLKKQNAYASVRAKGDMYLYRLAWKLHIQFLARRYLTTAERLHVVVGSFSTHNRAAQARDAVRQVCAELNAAITVSVWDAHSSIGIQAADYCLWATYQRLKGKSETWHVNYVEPIKGGPVFYPWGM